MGNPGAGAIDAGTANMFSESRLAALATAPAPMLGRFRAPDCIDVSAIAGALRRDELRRVAPPPQQEMSAIMSRSAEGKFNRLAVAGTRDARLIGMRVKPRS